MKDDFPPRGSGSPLPGWHRGLTSNERRWVEEWDRLDNKAAAVRIVWPASHAARRGWSMAQRPVIRRAMTMIRGGKWDGEEPKNYRGESLKPKNRDRKWRTRTARLHHRNTKEMKPLDCLLHCMQINWDEAEKKVKRSGEEVSETEESLFFRKEASLYAKEAAPYMHARLQSVEMTKEDKFEHMSDEELAKTIVDLMGELGEESRMTKKPPAGNGNGNGSRKPGMPPVTH